MINPYKIPNSELKLTRKRISLKLKSSFVVFRFISVGISTYLIIWNLAWLFDRSDFMLSRAERFSVSEILNWYTLVLYEIIPIGIALIAGIFLRLRTYVEMAVLVISAIVFSIWAI